MTILMLETIDDDAMVLLKSVAPVLVSPSPDAHAHELPFADITAIVTRGLGRLDRSLIEKCPRLKVIARCGAGLNNLDLDAAKEHGIPVVFAPGINAAAVAEHALMLMLMTLRSGFSSAEQVKQNNWACRNEFSGDDLSGKKICIVGSGKIGQKTAELCRAFSMEVVVCGRNGKGAPGLRESMEQQLPTSDIVSLHIPLAPETRELISREILALFKPGAILINTARGELIDTPGLIEALDRGHLKAYGTDVVAGETPKPDDPIVTHERSVVTPHVAAMTRRTYREMSLFTAINVSAILRGESSDPVSVYGKNSK